MPTTVLTRLEIDEILWRGPGGESNKRLDFGSDPDHDPALADVCAF